MHAVSGVPAFLTSRPKSASLQKGPALRRRIGGPRRGLIGRIIAYLVIPRRVATRNPGYRIMLSC